MQFYPVRLLPKDQERQAQAARGFVYCSASSGKNLVIAAADRSMYEFGRDQLEHVYQKRQRQLQQKQNDRRSVILADGDSDDSDEQGYDEGAKIHYTQFKPHDKFAGLPKSVRADGAARGANSSHRAILVSCGPSHCAYIDESRAEPYLWGDSSDCKLGLALAGGVSRGWPPLDTSRPTGNAEMARVLLKGSEGIGELIKRFQGASGGGASAAAASTIQTGSFIDSAMPDDADGRAGFG